jgi:ABC-type multidrug transport system ATPase subunit
MIATAEPVHGSPADDAVQVSGVRKRFGPVTALDDLSFTVRRGELFGFIGSDGGGKTTLFRILTTLLTPDAGTAVVLALDVVRDLWALRQRVGYMPGRFALYPDLSIEENLRFFASVFGTTVQREYDHIAPIYSQIEPFADRRAAALSGGMKQKLALCCALVHRPDILFLDEPTTGVDAVSRREFWDLLDRLKTDLTIVVSTPYMDEANRCDRVALIQKGRLLAVDTPAAITGSFDRPLIAVQAGDRYRTLQTLREYTQTATVYPFGDVLHYTDRRAGAPIERVTADLADFLRSRGLQDVRTTAIPATIEDSFMALMGSPDAADRKQA